MNQALDDAHLIGRRKLGPRWLFTLLEFERVYRRRFKKTPRTPTAAGASVPSTNAIHLPKLPRAE